MPDGADLENHHADGVGDDVVELTGDPRALLRHRDACGRLPLAFCLRCSLFRRFSLLRTLTQGVARDPGDHVPEGNEDEVARRLTGDVVDDDHDSDERDDQARACLQWIPQIPEQKRACQPDDAEAADERKQHSVAERDRHRQEPIGSRSAKGKRRRASRSSTRTPTVGIAIQSAVGGAAGESRPTTSSSMPAIARNAISSSNQYSRATYRIRLTR